MTEQPPQQRTSAPPWVAQLRRAIAEAEVRFDDEDDVAARDEVRELAERLMVLAGPSEEARQRAAAAQIAVALGTAEYTAGIIADAILNSPRLTMLGGLVCGRAIGFAAGLQIRPPGTT